MENKEVQQKNKSKSKSKTKEKIIVGSIMGVSVIAIAALGISVSLDKEENVLASAEQCYEISGNDEIKLKGASVISKEQKVFIDATLGKIESVKVSDKQHVNKGDVLFTYNNETVSEKIKELDIQINSSTKKKEKSNSNKSEYQDNINNLIKELALIESKINNISNAINEGSQDPKLAQELSKLQGSQVQVQGEIKGYKSQIVAEEAAVEAIQETIDTTKSSKEQLNSKVNVNVVSEIDGVVYIDDSAKENPTSAYMRVVSEEPLVKGEVSEYDLDTLAIGDKVIIRVNSNGEYINGEVQDVDNLPVTAQSPIGETSQSATYNFYVKPEKKITVGFNVEIKESGKAVEIPKEYVYEKDSKFYVAKVMDDGKKLSQKIEIKTKLSEDKTKYILIDGNISDGDKIAKNPKDILEGGTE